MAHIRGFLVRAGSVLSHRVGPIDYIRHRCASQNITRLSLVPAGLPQYLQFLLAPAAGNNRTIAA
jgi:hypothetical protein